MARYDTTEYNRYRRLRAAPRDYADHPYDRDVRGGRSYHSREMTHMGHGMDRVGARSGRYAPETRDYGPRRGYDVRGGYGSRGGGYDVRGGYAGAERSEGYLGNWLPGGYGSSRGLDSMSGGRPHYFTGFGSMNQGAVGYQEYRPNWW